MFGFSKTARKTNTDASAIDEIVTRSIASILPSPDALRSALLSGRRLKIYVGADATGPDLHLGHSTNFLLLERLRRLGHEVVILFGDFTASIGDPSGRDEKRKPLSSIDIERNLKTWKAQVAKVVAFSGSNPATIVRNSSWWKQMPLQDLIPIASRFTVQQMIERDMFAERIKRGDPVHLHEFLYPLLQGYDSVALNVDVEIGGNDQLFNMLAGRTLLRQIKQKEKFVIATTLLVNPKTKAKLMSKSEGGYVAMSANPEQMFGGVMALPDEVMVDVFTDCTMLPLSEIKSLSAQLGPRELKVRLAKEIVKLYHDASAGDMAAANFEKTFSKGEMPADAPLAQAQKGELLADILIKASAVPSKSEFYRLVKANAVSVVGGETITDEKFE